MFQYVILEEFKFIWTTYNIRFTFPIFDHIMDNYSTVWQVCIYSTLAQAAAVC